MKGKFIVFEGIDGSGKTTQINQLSKWITESNLIPKNKQLVITREPGGTKLGQSIRSLLLDTSIEKNPDSITELLLYAADRAQHINEIIRPSLNKGDWVISDRFCGSTLAYQGYGRKLDIKLIKDLETIATQGISPDITFLLDITVDESIKRRINIKDDRIENEGREFLSNVLLGFKKLSEDSYDKKFDIKLLNELSKRRRYKINEGEVIGTHKGAHFFTIGQRKGLSVGGHSQPLFVIDTDVKNNLVYVGEGANHTGLFRKALEIKKGSGKWIRSDLTIDFDQRMDVLVRIRYRQPLQEAIIYNKKEGFFVVFKNHQSSITSGQFAAWYVGEELIGSGVIN